MRGQFDMGKNKKWKSQFIVVALGQAISMLGSQFLETIRKYENVTELNRSMLVELIDSIYVYQAEGTGKERTQKVEINYRFLCESQCGIALWKW